MADKKRGLFKLLLQAIKIGVGTCAAILIAESLGLESAITAGSVALLSTLRTKWATVKLSVVRLITFGISMVILFPLYQLISREWIVFGIFMFLLYGICNLLQWGDTISVNLVVGAHLFMLEKIDAPAILNEFLLVLIGVLVATSLNLIYDNRNQKAQLQRDMDYVDENIRIILVETADYIYRRQDDKHPWQILVQMEDYIRHALAYARDYQDNTFHSHPGYYIQYFEMREMQCQILHNLFDELRQVRNMPKQANVIAYFLKYLSDYISEHNSPDTQLNELHKILDILKQQPLPESRNEFEARAILYHVLMNIEDFLKYKRKFIDSLSEVQRKIYWGR